MAISIPNQNNLNDVIKSITDQLDAVKQKVEEYNNRRKTAKTDIKKDMRHLRDDVQAVVEFIQTFSDTNFDKITGNLNNVIKNTSKLSDELNTADIKPIDADKLNSIVICNQTIAQLVKRLNKIKVESLDKDKLATIDEVIDLIFIGDGSLARNLIVIGTMLDGISYGIIMKFKIIQYSVAALSSLARTLIQFGTRVAVLRPIIKLVHPGITEITSIVGELATLIDKVYSIKQLKGGIMKMFGPHKRILLLRLILKSLVKLIPPMIKLGLYSWVIKPFRKTIPEYVGVISEIVGLIEHISKLGLGKLLLARLRVKLVKGFIKSLSQLLWSMLILSAIPTKIFTSANASMIEITALLTNVKASFDIIRSFGLFELIMSVIKIALLDTALTAIVAMMSYLGAVSYILKLVIPGLLTLEDTLIIMGRIVHYIDENFKLKTVLSVYIKAKLLRRLTRSIIRLANAIMNLAIVGYAATPFYPGLLMTELVVAKYADIVTIIHKTKFGLLFNMKLRRMIRATRTLKVLIYKIIRLTRIRGLMKATGKMILISLLVRAFAATVSALMVTSALLLIFVALSPVIILSILAFGLVMKLITFIVSKTVTIKSMIALALLTIAVTGFVILAVALLVIAVLAPVIVDNALNIVLFFGVIIAVTLALAAVGWIVSMAAEYLAPAIYGLGIVLAMVVVVLLIAVMLKLLQNIELDQDKIKENVKKVMATVMYIITCLFEDELNDPESKDSVFVRILKVIGGAVAKIIMALATCIILVATFVSVACILMIAMMLRVLQNLELDQNKILKNVDLVFDTVEKIIARFMSDDKGGKKSNRGLLITVMSWACPPMAKIAEALLSLAYLFLMFLAVTLVLGIASLLRLIQNLDLQITKIQENVDMVFDTVDQIINRIFGDRKDEEHKSSRGILIKIISWVDEGLAKIVEAALSIIYLALAMQAVAMVLAIASMLRLLQNLDLNVDKIKENTNTVFDTVDLIINRVFGDRKDEEHKSSRGILVTIISWVDEGLAKIVEAALTIVYLMLVLVAVSVVLGIAGLLKCIQDIDLQFNVIQEKVNTVFDTVDLIMNRVFAPTDDSLIPGNGILGKIIGLFNPGLAKIIDALMAIAYVGLAFVAISIVKGMAEALHEIQEIDLQPKTISEKVDTIFKICGDIMKQIYEKADTMLPEPKNRGLFGSIISFFSPGLAKIMDALTMIAKLAIVQTAISTVAGIGKALKQIQDIPTDLSTASEKVDLVMGIAENICTKIFSRESKINFPVPPKERESVFGALISWAFGGKSDEDRALEAAMKKVEALGVIEAAVGALGNILEGAKRIMDMEITDLTGAQTKVDEVMELATHLAESIFGANVKLTLPEPSDDDVKAALVELGYDHWWRSSNAGEKAAAKAQASMKLAMQRVETLGLIASAVGSMAAIIGGIDKIKNYQAPNLSGISASVKQVMSTASHISFLIFNQDGIGQKGGTADGIKSQLEEVKARIEFAKAGSDGVGQLCESFTSLIEKSKFDEKTITNTKAKVSSTISAISEIIAQMDEIRPEANGDRVKANCELMDRISKTVGSFVQVTDKDVRNSKNITENYIKFFKQVDSMDIKKLQHTDWLMQSWASISRDLKGDFEGLAKTINQHIMPMLEKVNETLEKTTKAQQEIIDVMSRPVDINGAGSAGGSFDSTGTTPSEGGTVDTSAPSGPTPGKDDTSGGTPVVKPTKKNLPNPGRPGGMNEEIKSGGTYEITVASVKKIK